MFLGKVKKTTELEAIVYPVCVCGEPWVAHGSCGGYKPSRPIQNLGTVSFKSPKILPTLLWKVEQFIKYLRQKVS